MQDRCKLLYLEFKLVKFKQKIIGNGLASKLVLILCYQLVTFVLVTITNSLSLLIVFTQNC